MGSGNLVVIDQSNGDLQIETKSEQGYWCKGCSSRQHRERGSHVLGYVVGDCLLNPIRLALLPYNPRTSYKLII